MSDCESLPDRKICSILNPNVAGIRRPAPSITARDSATVAPLSSIVFISFNAGLSDVRRSRVHRIGEACCACGRCGLGLSSAGSKRKSGSVLKPERFP